MAILLIEKSIKHLYKCMEYDDLIFFAERCRIEGVCSTKVLIYLALSYEQIGKSEKAISILKVIDIPSSKSNFILIKILLKKRNITEIEKFLIENSIRIRSKEYLDELKKTFGKYAGSAIKLISKYYLLLSDINTSIELLHSSLKLNPLLWSNVENICHLRGEVDLASIFTLINYEQNSAEKNYDSEPLFKTNNENKLNIGKNVSIHGSTPSNLIRRKKSPQIKKSKKTKSTTDLEENNDQQIEKKLTSIYDKIANFIKNCELYTFNIIEFYKAIPINHRDSYVNSYMAATLYHQQNFIESQKYFDLIISTDLFWTKHMDICSSNLWQINNSSKLEFIVDKLKKYSPLSYETWIAAGNFESLKKQHQQAIMYFKRAKLINPLHPYSYTLISQEIDFIESSQSDIGLKNILSLDPYHYQAWYFIGRVKSQQQNYTDALYYLKKAASINKNNSIILCSISYCYQKQLNFKKALHYINLAIQNDPSNTMLQYESASIHYEMNNYKESSQIIQNLLNTSKFDNSLLLLAAKVFTKLQKPQEAIECATKIINQNKYNPYADAEARDILKNLGLFQSSKSNINFPIPTNFSDDCHQ